MKFFTYLHGNAKWALRKRCFENLVAIPTTNDELEWQLKNLANRYYHERKKVDVLSTLFCLDNVALTCKKSPKNKAVLRHFDNFWQSYLQLKNILQKDYLLFPSNTTTRIEQICSLIAKCTGFCIGKNQTESILERCNEIFDLTEREVEYLPFVLQLYKINYFCALAQKSNDENQKRLAKMLEYQGEKVDCVANLRYRQGVFRTNDLVSVCDCMANSTVCFGGENPKVSQSLKVFARNRNLFDTFCNSEFFKYSAHFLSDTNSLKIGQKYFLLPSMEVRKTTIQNNGKNKNKFVVDIALNWENGESFVSQNALCIAQDNGYVGVAMVVDNAIAKCQTSQNCLTLQLPLLPNEQATFDVVTVYAKDMPTLANKLQSLNCFGATAFDRVVNDKQEVAIGQKLHLTPCSHTQRTLPQMPSKKLNFTYQMGDDDLATFVDNNGNVATLLQGFVFGTGGEKVYAVDNFGAKQLNVGKFNLDGKLVFDKQSSSCTVAHGDNKLIQVDHKKAQKTLFYFPLERSSQITFANNVFTLDDGKRHYTITCFGKVQSFTTDNIECNANRMRHKLSNNLERGDCLAIAFEKSQKSAVVIASSMLTPPQKPLLAESLVSTYLNYVNGKMVFCLNNFLKRPTALLLAGICYTNAEFVKNFLIRLWENRQEQGFYDASGKLQKCKDNLLFDLACIYYAMLVKEENFPTQQMKDAVSQHLLGTTFVGNDLCVQALALKKASQVNGFDKVQFLLRYTQLKKIICADKNLYPYAQAIGAVPLVNPSKERLKDLCNNANVPKNWYYVSQLENLYGLKLNANSLQFAPNVAVENLEQFALNFDGKRIRTTFEKSTVQCMTLNGTTYHQPFDPYSLKNAENTLVVSY